MISFTFGLLAPYSLHGTQRVLHKCPLTNSHALWNTTPFLSLHYRILGKLYNFFFFFSLIVLTYKRGVGHPDQIKIRLYMKCSTRPWRLVSSDILPVCVHCTPEARAEREVPSCPLPRSSAISWEWGAGDWGPALPSVTEEGAAGQAGSARRSPRAGACSWGNRK